MTAEMTREESTMIPEDVLTGIGEAGVARGPVRSPGALATQEQLDGLARLLAWFEEQNGPVPDEVQKQFDADLAAADAKIGRIR